MTANPGLLVSTSGLLGPSRAAWRRAGRALAITAAALAMAARPAAQRMAQGEVTCAGVGTCAGAVVWVEAGAGRGPVPAREAVIDQRQLTFVPHVLPVVQGTTVVFKNSDDVGHNVFSVSAVKRFNLGTYPRGVDKRLVFEQPGLVELLCNVHPEMSAFIVVGGATPPAAVGPDGRYALANLPDGAFTLAAWREGLAIQRRQVPAAGERTLVVNFALGR